MLKEIFEDQRKFVPYGIRVSQGAVAGVGVGLTGRRRRWEEVDWLGRNEKRGWGPWLIIFNSEEGGLGGSLD